MGYRNQSIGPLVAPTVSAVDGGERIFGVDVSDMQTSLAIANGAITGTLKYLDSENGGDIVPVWGEGNFMALAFTNFDTKATKVLVGLEPSVSSGLVDVLGDPDHNGIFKVTNKNTQRFVVQTKTGTETSTQYYSLSGLTLNNS